MSASMHLRVCTPLDTICDITVSKISLRTAAGRWTFLPRHADMVNIVAPGILSWTDAGAQTGVIALDEGLVTKKGDTVDVAVRNAQMGSTAEELEEIIKKNWTAIDEQESKARSIVAQLEKEFLHTFGDMRELRS